MGGGWLNMQMGPTSWIVVGTGAAAVGEIKRRPVPFDFLDQTKICNGRYLDMLSAFCRVPRGRPHLHIRPDDYLNFSDVGTGICHFKILSISILFSYPFVDAGGSSRLLRWIIHTRRGCMLSLRIPVIDTLCLCRRVRAEEIWGKKKKKRNVYIHRCGLQTKGKRKLLLEMRSICWDESSSFMTGNSLSCSLVQSGHSSYSGKSSLCAARQLNLLPSEEKRSCRVIVNGTKHAQSIEKLPSRLRPTWCRS